MFRVVVVICVFAIISAACNRSTTVTQQSTIATPQLDVPRYTNNEVVDMVKTNLTEGASSVYLIKNVQLAIGTANYLGKGTWSVVIPVFADKVYDCVFTFREVTKTVVATNESAAFIMGLLRVRPENRNIPQGGVNPVYINPTTADPLFGSK